MVASLQLPTASPAATAAEMLRRFSILVWLLIALGIAGRAAALTSRSPSPRSGGRPGRRRSSSSNSGPPGRGGGGQAPNGIPTQPVSLPCLTDLMSASGGWLQQGQPSRTRSARAPPRDSGRLREEQEFAGDGVVSSFSSASAHNIDAWLVLCKPTIRDQITVELAARLSAVVQLLVESEGSLPDIICLCGNDLDGKEPPMGSSPSSPPVLGGEGGEWVSMRERGAVGGASSAATLAYHVLRSAAEAQRIDLSPVSFLIVPHAEAREGVLSTAIAVRGRLREATAQRAAAAASGGGGWSEPTAIAPQALPPRLPPPGVRVKLISTDHHVHNIIDIDELIPRHSLLAPLRDLNAHVTFERASDPHFISANPDARRQARYVRLAEQLSAVRANLRGVEANTDFLHSDIARRIADVRSACSEALWELMPEHGGQHALRSPLDRLDEEQKRRSFGGGEGRDACELACLEMALGSLGRAQEALAPLLSDPIGGRISPDDLRAAQHFLTRAAASLRQADPDRPISPEEMLALLKGDGVGFPRR